MSSFQLGGEDWAEGWCYANFLIRNDDDFNTQNDSTV